MKRRTILKMVAGLLGLRFVKPVAAEAVVNPNDWLNTADGGVVRFAKMNPLSFRGRPLILRSSLDGVSDGDVEFRKWLYRRVLDSNR